MKDITPVPGISPLRAARDRRGMSREELAFKAGVSLKTIERLEAGQVEPRRATQRVIADVLECDPAVLWPVEEAA